MVKAASRILVVVAGLSLIAGQLAAQTIYPIDRAAILAGPERNSCSLQLWPNRTLTDGEYFAHSLV